MKTTELISVPAGLKDVAVAETAIGDVRGAEGFYHYREHDATVVSASRSFEAVASLLLDGSLPNAPEEAAMQSLLANERGLDAPTRALVERLAGSGVGPPEVLRAVLATLDPLPTIDQTPAERRTRVLQVIAMTPFVLANAHRVRGGLPLVDPATDLGHAADFLRMTTGEEPAAAAARAVETYLCLTADHGFNASTFTARVITSTGADIGGAYAGAAAALSGPLHGGAPSRVLDMIGAIGDPSDTERWAQSELDAGRKLMGFGHAVYSAEDPRGRLLRDVAIGLGGELVDRALEIETRMLAFLAGWKPNATLVTNVEFYAAVVLHLAGLPKEMFTAAFTTSRVVGWGAHILEQAANNKIIRPSARYVGPSPHRPMPSG